jgi:hypothetical protein
MREFKSEIGGSIFLCTLLALSTLAMLLWLVVADLGGWAVLAAVLLFIAAAFLPVYAFIWTKYFVNKHVLLIVCGPWTKSVPLNDIRFVQSVKSLAPAPALSSRRLQIHLEGGKTLMVSPQDARSFRRALGH